MAKKCECGRIIRHAKDHPGQCCACFDVSVGMPVSQALREERAAARREGVIEGLEDALSLVHDDEAVTRDLIRAEIERIKGEK